MLIERRAAWLVLAAFVCAAQPNNRAQILRPIHDVASALTGRNAVAAMTAFDKSLPGYDQLQARFSALTAAFDLDNQIDVEDEQDSKDAADLTLEWSLTLTAPQTNQTERRTGEIHARVALRDGKWKIVAFSPIDVFDPQPRTAKR